MGHPCITLFYQKVANTIPLGIEGEPMHNYCIFYQIVYNTVPLEHSGLALCKLAYNTTMFSRLIVHFREICGYNCPEFCYRDNLTRFLKDFFLALLLQVSFFKLTFSYRKVVSCKGQKKVIIIITMLK